MTAWADNFLQKEIPEMRGLHMERRHNGFAFKRSESEYDLVLSAAPAHYQDGRYWKPIDRQPQPRNGGFGFPWAKMGVNPDNEIFVGRSGYKLKSVGVFEGEKYIPLWQPEMLYAGIDSMVGHVGPFLYSLKYTEIGFSEELLIEEMPPLAYGDTLALEYDCIGLLPPSQCKCKPWARDATGEIFYIGKKRKESGAGKFSMISLDLLSSMAFPVVIDPEISAVVDTCWSYGSDASFSTARSTSTGGHGFSAFDNVGIRYTGTTYWIGRWGLVFDSSGSTGTIETASLKMHCSTDAYSANINDAYVFKQCDWGAWLSCSNNTMYESMHDASRDSVKGATITTIFELLNLGCGVTPRHYCPWANLLVGDVTHLNNNDGLGNNLYFAIISEDDHNGYEGGLGADDAKMIYLGYQMVLRINARGHFAWVIGG